MCGMITHVCLNMYIQVQDACVCNNPCSHSCLHECVLVRTILSVIVSVSLQLLRRACIYMVISFCAQQLVAQLPPCWCMRPLWLRMMCLRGCVPHVESSVRMHARLCVRSLLYFGVWSWCACVVLCLYVAVVCIVCMYVDIFRMQSVCVSVCVHMRVYQCAPMCMHVCMCGVCC